MRKIRLIACVVLLAASSIHATEPTMTIATNGSSKVLNVSDIRKVTYSGDNMIVALRDGNTLPFAMAEVSSVTLQNMPEPMSQNVEKVQEEAPCSNARKVLINGVIYIERDGQRFSILGAKL